MITALSAPTFNNLLKVAIDFSDAIILATDDVPKEVKSYAEKVEKPILPYVSFKEFEDAYSNFYTTEVLN